MKQIITITIALMLTFNLCAQNALKLKSIKQIDTDISFELSGITKNSKHGILVVADNQKDVYKIDTSDSWTIKKYIDVKHNYTKTKFDLEAIDCYGNKIFLLEERQSNIFKVNKKGKLKLLKVKYSDFEAKNKMQFHIKKWGNAGYEGMALDKKNKWIYLAKERTAKNLNDGRYIVVVKYPCGKIAEKFNVDTLIKNTDFTDIKVVYTNGKPYLFALHRNEYIVSKIDPTSKKLQKYDFGKFLTDKDRMLTFFKAENPQYGIAEALLITDNEIWIGLDNNDEPINETHPLAKKYKLKGKQPVILIFERPKGF